MRLLTKCIVLLSTLILSSCEKKMSQGEVFRIGTSPCAVPAGYTQTLGFEPGKSAFSTSERNIKGIVLKDLPQNVSDTIGKKIYQHPSWGKFGSMGAITNTDDGTVFTAPIPVINTLDRPLSKMNRIYKLDNLTGEMKEFCVLPQADTSTGVVPFAILGLYFDCHGKVLYASTVAGSSREKENGIIYAIDAKTSKIIDKLAGIDAASVFVCGITGEKKLYFGHARTSAINSVELNRKGEFVGDIKREFSIEGLGPRGDDKARRIRMDETRYLTITGVEFNFNLATNTDSPPTVYRFIFNGADKRWINIK